MDKKLSTDPYKGVRDFYPADKQVHNHILAAMRAVPARFGYEEYDASILEPAELYRQKSGDEIVNEQAYVFTDRGGREVALRPEMTPTLARLVAARRRDLPLPVRWFSVPNLFRYERPQRGRLREHWQLNADAFGADTVNADAEVIEIAARVLFELGMKPEHFEIRLSDRRLLAALYRKHEVSPENTQALSRLVDRMSKMERSRFEEELYPLVPSDPAGLASLMAERNAAALEALPEAAPLRDLADALAARGVTNVRFDPSLVRGLDYYTGTVFELFDLHPDNNRALAGGGRYDDLVSLFEDARIPAVGFGMGDAMLEESLATYGLLPSPAPAADIALLVLPGGEAAAARLAAELRAAGLRAAADWTGRKAGDMLKSADKQGIPHAAVIGEDEARSGRYKVKRLATGAEREAGAADIAEIVRARE